MKNVDNFFNFENNQNKDVKFKYMENENNFYFIIIFVASWLHFIVVQKNRRPHLLISLRTFISHVIFREYLSSINFDSELIS